MPKFCTAPFTILDIKEDGSCSICCEQWLPYKVGNLYENSLDSIWNGNSIRTLRESILDGSFKFCDNTQCPELASGTLPTITETTKEQKIQILERKIPVESNIRITNYDPQNKHFETYGDDYLLRQIKNKYPSQVNLTYDRSCNLQCPSCRKEVINVTQGPEYDRIKSLHTEVINTLFDEPHNDEIILNITGSGDPFASKLFREFLFDFDPTPWPNVKLGLQTHGGLLTSANWQKMSQWHDKIAYVKICFDAANENTYNIVRKKGNWNQLMSNCDFMNDQLTHGFGIADFIVQDHNFKEIPEFVELMLSRFEFFDYICFYLVNNWGTWSDEEFKQRAIWDSSHPRHQELRDVLTHPILQHPKVMLGPLKQML
jgi:hypothetical protein